jgi:heat shock protein HslJ
MKKKLRALFLPLAVVAAGCGSNVMTGPSAVVGGVWKLFNMQPANSSGVAIPQPENYTVEFKDADQLSVRADCNSCSGSYQISGDSLHVGLMACTQVYCGPASLDSQYLAILGSATSFGVEDGVLTIHSPQGTLRYTR